MKKEPAAKNNKKRHVGTRWGKSGDCLVQQLRPLRQLYADLTEFAPIWEAFDKIEGAAS
jgi:hypothetical protein